MGSIIYHLLDLFQFEFTDFKYEIVEIVYASGKKVYDVFIVHNIAGFYHREQISWHHMSLESAKEMIEYEKGKQVKSKRTVL